MRGWKRRKPRQGVTSLSFFSNSENKTKHTKNLHNQKSFKIEPVDEETVKESLSLSL